MDYICQIYKTFYYENLCSQQKQQKWIIHKILILVIQILIIFKHLQIYQFMTSYNTISSEAQCRICLISDKSFNLLKPCKCTGTVAYFHKNCLRKWIEMSFTDFGDAKCQICKEKIHIKTILKIEFKLNEDKHFFLFCFFFMLILEFLLICGILILIYIIQWESLLKTVIFFILIIFAGLLLYPLGITIKQACLYIQTDWMIQNHQTQIQSNIAIIPINSTSNLIDKINYLQQNTINKIGGLLQSKQLRSQSRRVSPIIDTM